MGTTWVLHTETKGTGAQMVPLKSIEKRSSTTAPVLVRRKSARPSKQHVSEPKAPRRFRIVDLMTRQTLVDDASTQEAVNALKDVRSAVDVNVYVWQEARERWRLLPFADKRAMLDLARQ
jgi:hypothetical protein